MLRAAPLQRMASGRAGSAEQRAESAESEEQRLVSRERRAWKMGLRRYAISDIRHMTEYDG